MPAPKGHEPYPGCETGGRPKIYTTEFIEKLADDLEEWIKNGKFLWFERFAIQHNLCPDYMKDFANENEKFFRAYRKAKAYQRVILYEGSLLKKFQYNAVQLILGHEYGIFAKTEQKLSGDAVDPLAFVVNINDGNTKDLLKEEDDE